MQQGSTNLPVPVVEEEEAAVVVTVVAATTATPKRPTTPATHAADRQRQHQQAALKQKLPVETAPVEGVEAVAVEASSVHMVSLSAKTISLVVAASGSIALGMFRPRNITVPRLDAVVMLGAKPGKKVMGARTLHVSDAIL